MRWLTASLWTIILTVSVVAQTDESSLIHVNETIELAIVPESPTIVEYLPETDRYIRIQAVPLGDEETPLDAVLWVLDEQDRLVAYNNNSPESINPSIDNLWLTSRSYTIYVDSFNGVSQGRVELTLETVDPFSQVIENEETLTIIDVTLPEDRVYAHSVEANQGERLSITARDISDRLDTVITIIDESNQILVSNDDHNTENLSLNLFDSRIAEWIVPNTGIYSIEVRDFLGTAGQFQLMIEVPE